MIWTEAMTKSAAALANKREPKPMTGSLRASAPAGPPAGAIEG